MFLGSFTPLVRFLGSSFSDSEILCHSFLKTEAVTADKNDHGVDTEEVRLRFISYFLSCFTDWPHNHGRGLLN